MIINILLIEFWGWLSFKGRSKNGREKANVSILTFLAISLSFQSLLPVRKTEKSKRAGDKNESLKME